MGPVAMWSERDAPSRANGEIRLRVRGLSHNEVQRFDGLCLSNHHRAKDGLAHVLREVLKNPSIVGWQK